MRLQRQRLAVILRRHQLFAGDGFHQFQSCVVHGSGSFGEVSIFVVRCNVTYAAPVEKRPLPIESNRGIARWPFPPRVHWRSRADQRVLARPNFSTAPACPSIRDWPISSNSVHCRGRDSTPTDSGAISPGCSANSRSEEHTSELQSLMRISSDVLFL